MAREDRFTLFGTQSPEQVRASIGKAGLEQDLSIAALPAGRGPVAAAAGAGRMLGAAIGQAFGAEDPAVVRARNLREALTEANDSASSDHADYLQKLITSLSTRGLVAEASQARESLNILSGSRAKAELEAKKVAETTRHNVVTETTGIGRLQEKQRSNKIRESIQRDRNAISAERNLVAAEKNALVGQRLDMAQRRLQLAETNRHEVETLNNMLVETKSALSVTPDDPDLLMRKATIEDAITKAVAIVDKEGKLLGKGGTRARVNDLVGRAQTYKNMIGDMRSMLDIFYKDPTQLGIIGSLRGISQEVKGVSRDFAKAFGSAAGFAQSLDRIASDALEKDIQNGLVGDDVKERYFNKNLALVPMLENKLAYLIARTNKPAGLGKLAVDDVKRAEADAKLQGAISSDKGIAKLENIVSFFERHLGDLNKQLDIELSAGEDFATKARDAASPPKGVAPDGTVIYGKEYNMIKKGGKWVRM